MSPERAGFLALLRARTAQRCPGRCDSTVDLDGGHVTVGCNLCGAMMRLPLRQPERPAPEPPIRASHLQRVEFAILDAAWGRWRARFAANPSRWGPEHAPVELAEGDEDEADDGAQSDERAA